MTAPNPHHPTAQMRSLLLGLAVLLLAACASSGSRHAAAAAETAPDFPDPARASLKEGLFVDVDNLRLFARGMSKRQLYALLGTPHFNEGMWNVREWNYLFNFRSAPNGDYFTCQFQVQFDAKGIAQAGHWKPQSCAAVLQPPAPPLATAQPMPSEPVRLSADALFAFDSAELSAGGQRSVQALLEQVRSASQVQAIAVAGHTDRIGGAAYNQALSQRRADALRAALVQGGVPAAAITATGHGSAQPLVQCDRTRKQSLIACLAPNRRVEISGVAQRAGQGTQP